MHLAVIIDLYPRRMMGCQLHAIAAEGLQANAPATEVNLMGGLLSAGLHGQPMNLLDVIDR